MANSIITIKVMPESPDVNLEELKAKVKEIRTAKRLESLALAVLDIDDIDQLDL